MKKDLHLCAASVEHLLAAARQRCRSQVLLSAVMRVLGLVLALLMVGFILDYHLDIPVPVRAVLLAAACAGFARAAWVWLVRPLGAAPAREALARVIERAHPEFKGEFLTAVQLAAPANPAAAHVSAALVAHIEERAGAQAALVDVRVLYPVRRMAAPAVFFGGLCLLWLVLGVWMADVLPVWRARLLLGDVPWPRTVDLVVTAPEGREVLVARGDDLMIEVTVRRGRVRHVELLCTWPDGRRADTMTRWGDRVFRHNLTNLTRPFTFRARGGDGVTPAVDVRLVTRPRVERIVAAVAYPDYTGAESVRSEDGTVKALMGSRVTFRAWVRPHVKEAEFRLFGAGSDTPHVAETLSVTVQDEDSVIDGGFVVERSGYYTFRLVSVEGFENESLARYQVRAIPDGVPVVRIASPPVTEECTPTARIAITGAITDDWGIVSAQRVHRIQRPGEDPGSGTAALRRTAPLAIDTGAKEALIASEFDLAALDAREEDQILWTVEATDAAGGTGRSEERMLVVVRPADLRAILFERLTMVREDLRALKGVQEKSRRRMEALARDTAGQARLDAQAAPALGQARGDALSVGRRLAQAAQDLGRLRDRMSRNVVGDLKEQKWIGSLGLELDDLVEQKVSPLARELEDLAQRADSGNVSPSALAPLAARQKEIEDYLEDMVQRMTQFGDINDLIRRLEEILRAQERVRALTREMLDP